ncbi:hypothetical protein XA68_12295 [Ophiocordyceps unilateralis]|uniref:tRNA (uracil-O(2)-)-methyltransferase n=1 Tax=Ophiocordyceps unilateralis TaxID=268505 RepID=A0A2A9PEZ1_OPHUN|nr:hypothetical protein XA68_12295 [Ophiocordyceps unilateralis]
MAPFKPDELPAGTPPGFDDETSSRVWVPLYSHDCTFGPDLFVDKMMNLVRNPNLNSSWLFRADILYDREGDQDESNQGGSDQDGCNDANASDIANTHVRPLPRRIRAMPRQRSLVRRLIPRNRRRDAPLDQTCTFHRGPTTNLVIYAPHVTAAAHLPFYHPAVRAVGHLHRWDPVRALGSVSVLVLPFDDDDDDDDKLPIKVRRTAYHLLELLHKHGQSSAAGYVKRVHHDRIVPQARLQNRYAALKDKYARRLVESWAESTDPLKHVFEDLAIAAFLIELWADMYADDDDGHDATGPPRRFPGFVDIGCGNGLLVYVLHQEGYPGWGFDARTRKSWNRFRLAAPDLRLECRLLLPAAVSRMEPGAMDDGPDVRLFHDGSFPPGTFIISNHADELTAWTPILAAASRSPFIAIPCCSHNLAGDRFRAPPPKRAPDGARSTYASLVDWVARIAVDCGWEVETEMLRIPSTRNTCLLARRRLDGQVDVDSVVDKFGGVKGYSANVVRLLKSDPSFSH